MDPKSAHRQLFQLTSLSVFSTQRSHRSEVDTISHTQARTRIMTLVNFNLVFFFPPLIVFHPHSALTGPPRDTQ